MDSFSEKVTEVAGWIGIVLILIAYILASLGVVEATSGLYLFLNLFGAIGVAIDALADKNIQPVVLNVVWIAVAVIGLIRLM
jgi:hypothetical protein